MLNWVFKGRIIDKVMGIDEESSKLSTLGPSLLLLLCHTHWLVAVCPFFARLPRECSKRLNTQHAVTFDCQSDGVGAHAVFNHSLDVKIGNFLIQVVENGAAGSGSECLRIFL